MLPRNQDLQCLFGSSPRRIKLRLPKTEGETFNEQLRKYATRWRFSRGMETLNSVLSLLFGGVFEGWRMRTCEMPYMLERFLFLLRREKKSISSPWFSFPSSKLPTLQKFRKKRICVLQEILRWRGVGQILAWEVLGVQKTGRSVQASEALCGLEDRTNFRRGVQWDDGVVPKTRTANARNRQQLR